MRETLAVPTTRAGYWAAIREAIRLRYRLMPYLYTLYRRAATDSAPILRPLFYDFDADPRAFDDCDDFMLGPDLLIANVVEPGQRERSVYLPQGVEGWYDFHTGTYYAAGSEITVEAPLDRIPMFARAGAIDGVSYTGLEIGGHLDFQTTAIRLPSVIPVGTVFDYDLPFQLSGLFVAIRRDREIMNVPVIGQGRLALSLRGIIPDQNGMSTFVARDRSVFTFGSTPTPTPEPTTLLMMTAGVALTARRFRTRERDL